MLRNYLLLSLIPLLLLISVTPYVDAQNSLKCPDGAYYGKDNSGNDVCRDIDTNKIIKTATSQSTTSQSASQTPSQQKSPSFFDMISQFFQNLFGGVSSEPLKKSVDFLSNPPSIDLPLLSEDKTSKLEDCSIYKKQIQGSTDVDKIYDAVIKTDACEERNKKITMKQGTVTSQSGSYPPVTLKMDNKSRGGVTADFTIESVRVQNSDYYKIVNVEMSMLLHMKLNDSIVFSPTMGWKLKDPSGEYYYEKCHGRQSDLGIIFGDSNPNRKWSICFHVEKESKQFDLMKDSNKIGTILLEN